MHKKYIIAIIASIMTIGVLAGCNKLTAHPNQESGNFLPPPPPPPTGEFNEMRRKLDAACISGIMQTGSDIFKELSKNGGDKLSKLQFIKEKLESIYKNASENSKQQISKQLETINSMIDDMEKREAEVKSDPNVICRKTEELKKMNRNIRDRIMGLSGDIKDIREHEKKENIFEHIKEDIFGKKDKEDRILEEHNKSGDFPKEIEKEKGESSEK